MRIAVLNPPTNGLRFSRDGRCQSEENTWLDTFPPTTLASIAGVLRRKYKIKLIDCIGDKISYEKCIRMVKKFKPEFTVINTSTPTIRNDLEVAKIVKEGTNSKIIMYGEHITSNYKKILKNFHQIDYAILGEPETPIINILNSNSKVRGVATEKFDGGIWQEPNLDALPFPAYDFLPVYKYPLTGEKWMFIRNGRGCPYGCIYCVMPLMSSRKIRYHSVDYMIRQIKWLVYDLKINLFMLWDELATFDKERMLNFCRKMVDEGLHEKCKWFCTTRVDHFDEDLAKNMKRAGCRMISFGIESGSQKVLDQNKKGITLDQILNAVNVAKKYGLRTIGHFIIGLPGSSPETAKATIKLAKRLKLNFAQFYIATPFPGSEFYKECLKNKWFVNNNWNHIEQGTVTISYPNFSVKQIKKWKDKAYISFYFRPYAIYSVLTSISMKKIFELPKYVIKFFGWMKK